MDIDENTRIIDLTVGEVLELVTNVLQKREPKQEAIETVERRKAYGIAGIAQIFNCSMTTANRIKKSGRIDGAISQHGRIIVVDTEKALELFNNK